jgi:hypothetical protein
MTTNQGMQGLIAIVNKLQDAFAHLGLSGCLVGWLPFGLVCPPL